MTIEIVAMKALQGDVATNTMAFSSHNLSKRQYS